MNDLRFAFRQLAKNPGFTMVAVLTLALGIGANTAMFSFVDAILRRPLPFKDPERLVMVFEAGLRGSQKGSVSAPLVRGWREQTTVFEGLAARGFGGFILTGTGQPESIPGSRLSANIFSLLGIKPILGRDFLAEEETLGNDHVVLLSYEFWQQRFAGNATIVGQSITLNDELFTVIGVMPPRTFFPERNTQLWTPLAFSPDQLRDRGSHNYLVYGRLKPGVTLANAQAEMDLIAPRVNDADHQGWKAHVYPLQGIIVGDSRSALLFLLGSVGLVLLIACANVANLLLARSAARAREFAIRAALGARRGQIIGQLLNESMLLAGLGGLAGILLAFFGLQALSRFTPPDLPRIWEGIHLDVWTLAFTVIVTLTAGVLFGLAPVFQASEPALGAELNEGSRGSSAGRQRQRFRAVLVMSEVALSLMLLIGAGLMLRSFSRLLSQQLGYNPEHLLSMEIGLPGKKYPAQADKVRFFEQFLGSVQLLPGVQSAALVRNLPLSGQNTTMSISIHGTPPPAPGEANDADYAQVSPGYFRTMNIPFLQGRDFTDRDRTNATTVTIVNETFIKNFKLGTNALHRLIGMGGDADGIEIIGVVKDVKRTDLASTPAAEVYRTYEQQCWGFMSLVLRTQCDPMEITRAVRSQLDTLDKDQPIENVRTMTQLISTSVSQRRLSVQLLGGFAGVAMLLAAIGLYGVLAHSVTQRTQEMGIRQALGAKRIDVVSLVVGQGMKLAVSGMLIGLAGAFVLARIMRSVLFGVDPIDPVTFASVPLLMVAVALLACLLPACRAAKVDPMEALRHE